MNRIKKELRKKGFKLESDYEVLPYDIKGHFMEPGHICIEGVTVDSEKAIITEFYNVISVKTQLTRTGELIDRSDI